MADNPVLLSQAQVAAIPDTATRDAVAKLVKERDGYRGYLLGALREYHEVYKPGEVFAEPANLLEYFHPFFGHHGRLLILPLFRGRDYEQLQSSAQTECRKKIDQLLRHVFAFPHRSLPNLLLLTSIDLSAIDPKDLKAYHKLHMEYEPIAHQNGSVKILLKPQSSEAKLAARRQSCCPMSQGRGLEKGSEELTKLLRGIAYIADTGKLSSAEYHELHMYWSCLPTWADIDAERKKLDKEIPSIVCPKEDGRIQVDIHPPSQFDSRLGATESEGCVGVQPQARP